MFFYMAMSAQGHQIPKCIIAELAAFDLVMDLKILQ